MSTRPSLAKGKDFVLRNARLLDRYRFSFRFERGTARRVTDALAVYQNPDGGFAHALEPDLRGPDSQPIPVWTAFGILDEVGALEGPVVRDAIDFLQSVTTRDGGVPFVLPTVRPYPHAPWWDPPRGAPPPALNPTAGVAALLHKNGVSHRWLGRATRWCWDQIEGLKQTNPYELRVILQFLDHVPERSRAEAALERLRPMILDGHHLVLSARSTEEGFRPLEVAPQPKTLSRTLFTPSQIDAHLDRVVRLQKPDGGWDFDFPVWTPVTRCEWRGTLTVDLLSMLKANGRLQGGVQGHLHPVGRKRL